MPQSLALVAEDDPGVRLLVVRALEQLGFGVLEAADGDEGYALARAQPDLDLLVTDVEMPGRNGIELAAEVRARFPHIPVLLITGGSATAPGLPVLRKPFGIEDLQKAVRRLGRSVP